MNIRLEYQLDARVDYMRRPLASTLLYSMAKHAQRIEAKGHAVEFIQGYCAEDGDYVGVLVVDAG